MRARIERVVGVVVVVGSLVAGCGHLGRQPYALYPGTHDAAELAVLAGPIAEVDQQPVAVHGSTFGLLPGCHVVVLKNAIGEGGASGAWSAHLPRMVYAFRMRAGHHYVIDYRTDDSSGPVGKIFIKAFDRDPAGSNNEVPLASSGRDIETCRAWDPSQPG